jgi:hypothetical protein
MTADQEAPAIAMQLRRADAENDPSPIIKSGWATFHRCDWGEAGCCWSRLREKFPDLLAGYSGWKAQRCKNAR